MWSWLVDHPLYDDTDYRDKVEKQLKAARKRELALRISRQIRQGLLLGVAAIMCDDGFYHCTVCGRKLTHIVSITLGKGPICGHHTYNDRFLDLIGD